MYGSMAAVQCASEVLTFWRTIMAKKAKKAMKVKKKVAASKKTTKKSTANKSARKTAAKRAAKTPARSGKVAKSPARKPGKKQLPGTRANRQEGDRPGACQKGPGRHISGTQTSCQEGDHDGQKGCCSGGSRNSGRPSRAEASSRRAEAIRAALESRRSRVSDGIAEPGRDAVAVGSSGFACGAAARNAGAAIGSQQYPVDVGSREWTVGRQRLVTRAGRSPCSPRTA
jgi:hypothetical protein